MKLRTFFALFAAMVLTACDDSDVYYTTAYPVVRVEAEATLTSQTPPAEEGEETPENPLKAQIEAEVVAAAPVAAGGRYVLDFVKYNGGRLTVYPAEGAGLVAGTFLKTPGQTDLQFLFGDNDYTCAMTAYSSDAGERALLTVNLTEHYQALYPDAGITRVVRREYTTHDRY